MLFNGNQDRMCHIKRLDAILRNMAKSITQVHGTDLLNCDCVRYVGFDAISMRFSMLGADYIQMWDTQQHSTTHWTFTNYCLLKNWLIVSWILNQFCMIRAYALWPTIYKKVIICYYFRILLLRGSPPYCKKKHIYMMKFISICSSEQGYRWPNSFSWKPKHEVIYAY